MLHIKPDFWGIISLGDVDSQKLFFRIKRKRGGNLHKRTTRDADTYIPTEKSRAMKEVDCPVCGDYIDWAVQNVESKMLTIQHCQTFMFSIYYNCFMQWVTSNQEWRLRKRSSLSFVFKNKKGTKFYERTEDF